MFSFSKRSAAFILSHGRRFSSAVSKLPILSRFATARHRREFEDRRVNFLIGGVQKGGSSALAQFLSAHPDVCFSNIKEVNYFNEEPFSDNAEDYHANFPRPRGRSAIGEASIAYVYCERAARRIYSYNRDMRIIFTIRNPIERAYSHYQMHVAKQGLQIPFRECIQLGAQNRPKEQHVHRCEVNFPLYLDYSRYAQRIRGYRERFEKVICLRQEDLRDHHAATLKRVFEFLEIDPSVQVPPATVYSHPHETMPRDVWEFLSGQLMNEIDELEAELGWDLESWRHPAA